MQPLHITLGGRDRPLLFSVAAIEEIEAAMGRTIVSLVAVPNFDVGLTGLITMLHVGIKHGGEGNLARERIRTMVDRDFEKGTLTIKDLIEVVQKGLVRSTTFRSQVAPEILDELNRIETEEAEKKASGNGRPSGSGPGESPLTLSSIDSPT